MDNNELEEKRMMINFSIADRWPFDADDENNPVDAGDWATRAARAVIANMQDRRKIKHGFDEIDLDIRREIVATLAEIIRIAWKEAQ